MDHGIDVRGLVVEMAGRRILDSVDLTVGRGRIAALLGPNGAGKTTTINVLTGLLRAKAGSVHVAGIDVMSRPREVRRHISVTGQSAALDELLTGAENLHMMGRLWGLNPRAARDRAAELLAQFDLHDAAGRNVRDCSGGTAIGNNAALGVTWCCGLLIAAMVWAAWLFRRKATHH